MLPDSLQNAPRVLEGVRFDVHRVSIPSPGGQAVQRDIIAHPGSVLILPIMDEGHIVLIRNHRVAFDETLWELPAGTLEPGEDPLACARREIIEETGYEAASLEAMMMLYPSPGICNERMHAFVARGLTHVGQRLDAAESITAHVLPWADVMAKLGDGSIRDAKTIAALLHSRTFGALAPSKRSTGGAQ